MKSAMHAALFAALLGSAAAIAGAHIDDHPATRTVSFADLDLTRDAGVAALYARIRAAAHEVCGQPDLRQLGEYMRSRRCAERAIVRGLRDANAPLSSAHYLARR
jgi:UrcA family protein